MTGLGKAMAMFLIGLLLAASGAPCAPAAPLTRPVVAAFDPCGHKPAPAPQCAQLACKTFAVPAAMADCAPAAAVSQTYLPLRQSGVGRLVRPPLPPPRPSMI